MGRSQRGVDGWAHNQYVDKVQGMPRPLGCHVYGARTHHAQ